MLPHSSDGGTGPDLQPCCHPKVGAAEGGRIGRGGDSNARECGGKLLGWVGMEHTRRTVPFCQEKRRCINLGLEIGDVSYLY